MTGDSIKKKKQQTKHRLLTSAKSKSNSGTNAKEAASLKILSALAELDAFKTCAHDKQKVAIAAGYKSTDTKSFREAIIQLRNNEDIECLPAKKILLTEQGRARVGPAINITPKTNEEMLFQIVKIVKIPGHKQGCGKFVDSLKDGGAKTKLQVARDMGLTSTDTKSFRNCLKVLVEQGMVEKVDCPSSKSLIRLSDDAFPQGRPL